MGQRSGVRRCRGAAGVRRCVFCGLPCPRLPLAASATSGTSLFLRRLDTLATQCSRLSYPSPYPPSPPFTAAARAAAPSNTSASASAASAAPLTDAPWRAASPCHHGTSGPPGDAAAGEAGDAGMGPQAGAAASGSRSERAWGSNPSSARVSAMTASARVGPLWVRGSWVRTLQVVFGGSLVGLGGEERRWRTPLQSDTARPPLPHPHLHPSTHQTPHIAHHSCARFQPTWATSCRDPGPGPGGRSSAAAACSTHLEWRAGEDGAGWADASGKGRAVASGPLGGAHQTNPHHQPRTPHPRPPSSPVRVVRPEAKPQSHQHPPLRLQHALPQFVHVVGVGQGGLPRRPRIDDAVRGAHDVAQRLGLLLYLGRQKQAGAPYSL